ncbi:MAG: 1-acyl-sn-glycerol-3-phosphate acyltransferase [Pseudomonadota bacterium]|nr:1-acyl-sn-glycerol-3-phosphate acyltransferase [Pseudomonadota bacterium]
MQRVYTLYCLLLFVTLGMTTLVINLFLPGPRRRRQVAGAFSRGFLFGAGIPFTIQGTEQLPAAPCVVVANHASYIDGIIAIAALPADFAFVIKKEMVRVPLAGLLLRRLGSEFVERFDRHKGASDARRVWRLAATGQSLVFFPEGTFDERRGIRKFLGGAFATAERSAMPVVAAAIHGTREMFPPGGLMLYRRPVRFEILAVLDAKGARQQSRELIARAVGEALVP